MIELIAILCGLKYLIGPIRFQFAAPVDDSIPFIDIRGEGPMDNTTIEPFMDCKVYSGIDALKSFNNSRRRGK